MPPSLFLLVTPISLSVSSNHLLPLFSPKPVTHLFFITCLSYLPVSSAFTFFCCAAVINCNMPCHAIGFIFVTTTGFVYFVTQHLRVFHCVYVFLSINNYALVSLLRAAFVSIHINHHQDSDGSLSFKREGNWSPEKYFTRSFITELNFICFTTRWDKFPPVIWKSQATPHFFLAALLCQ